MKKAILLSFSFLLVIAGGAQKPYWQQRLAYTIEVTINPADKTLEGFEKIRYYNASPDTLRYIWFHLWPNAYKTDKTAYAEQTLQGDDTRFYFSSKADRGYINRLDFKVDGITAKTEDHPQHIDITKLLLPQPLPPGGTITIATPFHVKLPRYFSRSGFEGSFVAAAQWYPKPAVYDAMGWHPMPYLEQGEFYSEIGSYDVRVSLPGNYVLAATGSLQDMAELNRLKQATRIKNIPAAKSSKLPVGKKNPPVGKKPAVKKNAVIPPTTAASKILHYRIDSTHDFAFFANSAFLVDYDTCRLPSGKVIDVFTYYTAAEKTLWKEALRYAKDAVRFYSAEVGEYPYTTLSVVQGPEGVGGGMEYPTITVIEPAQSAKMLDQTIAHEVGHNWFYGILANNERDHPWLDEGLNSFYERKYAVAKWGAQSEGEELLFQTLAKQHRDQPIATSSEAFTTANYGLVAYYKTGAWLKSIEAGLGTDRFRALMQDYYRKWAFKHPIPEAFAAMIRDSLPEGAPTLLVQTHSTGILPGHELKGFRIISPLAPQTIKNWITKPSKDILFVSPAVGANAYDRFMIGAIVSNIKLPPSRLQYLLAPLYSTGVKVLRGIGQMNYSFYPVKGLRKVEASLSGATFSNNAFVDEDGKKHFGKFTKLAPALTLFFREKDMHSKHIRSLQWKSFFIGETPFRIGYDSIVTPVDTTLKQTVQTVPLRFAVHQLRYGVENYRALYPYQAFFTAQGSSNFLRLTFEGSYFFNYAKGGLSVRLFAGKFFYDEPKQYNYAYHIDRFALNLTGANGEEDYTYSHYFFGRNKFEGLASQQLAIRDGGFKVRTDLLSNKVGKSGDWLAAINLSTSIPSLPVRFFADIGTYAEAWDRNNSDDRFLFDAGLHIPLFQIVNIYLPIVYSRPFADYFKTTYPEKRLLKTASFSIDLQPLLKPLRKQLLF